MGFQSVRALAQSIEDDGKRWISFFHKTGGPASFGTGRWADMSMGAGTPKYNAYVGVQAAATVLTGVGNDGIYAGPNGAVGETKHLHRLQIMSTSTTLVPATFMLCDYLLHYPLIDGDDTAQQDLDNSAVLTRSVTGLGVMAMPVCTTPMVANAIVTVSYTNSDGVAGRTSTFSLIASTVVGVICASTNSTGAAGSTSPFIPLQGDDKGVRSIEAVTLAAGAGGFFAMVLVKPIGHIVLRENSIPSEIIFVPQRGGFLPVIDQGAYLNFIYQPGVNGTAVTLRGELEFAWR